MTASEQQDAEMDRILKIERERQKTIKMILDNGGAVWDHILGRWVEVVR